MLTFSNFSSCPRNKYSLTRNWVLIAMWTYPKWRNYFVIFSSFRENFTKKKEKKTLFFSKIDKDCLWCVVILGPIIIIIFSKMVQDRLCFSYNAGNIWNAYMHVIAQGRLCFFRNFLRQLLRSKPETRVTVVPAFVVILQRPYHYQKWAV